MTKTDSEMTPQVNEDLAKTEQERLVELERVVLNGKQTFLEVGLALMEIRDNRLYRKKHDTFDDYCQKRWGWTAGRARQLISSALVVKALPEKSVTKVTDERTARALAKVPPEQREAVVSRAAKSGKVTAAAIKEAAKKPETIELDRTGVQIPKGLLEEWNRAVELASGLRFDIGKVRSAVEAAQERKDEAWREVNFSEVVAQLNNGRAGIKLALPYAVCPKCSWRARKGCDLCKEKGWISKFRFGCVPEELKTGRAGKA